MRAYDPKKPLIYIHVPKTAGSSVREIFKGWFKPQFYAHYYDEEIQSMLKRQDGLFELAVNSPCVIYGHFNKKRSFGIEDYYPDIDQFITILRDPYEMTVSRYRYLKRVAPQRLGDYAGFDDFMLNTNMNMLNHFPCDITWENYKSVMDNQFVEIGITEKLEESLQRISQVLGKTIDLENIPRVNVSTNEYHENSEIKQMYKEKFALEYAVYNYAKAMYD